MNLYKKIKYGFFYGVSLFDYSEEPVQKTQVRTSIVWLMPTMTLIYMLSLAPFGINSAHWNKLFTSLAISIGFASVLQLFWLKLKSFGVSLLFLFSVLFLVGLFLHALAPLIIVVFIVSFIFVVIKIRKLNVKQIFVLSITILFSACLFSLVLFQRSDMGDAQPFMSLDLFRDTIFHVAIASMIKTYGVISMGLHGIPVLNYHAASHVIFAAVSLISGLSVFDTYAYIYPLVFIPLMLVSFLCFIEELLPSKKIYEWIIRSSVVTILMIGLECGVYRDAAFWTSFYSSESYTLSIILLMGALSLLVKRDRSTYGSNLFFNTFALFFIFALICFSKISVGFIFLWILLNWVIFSSSKTFISRAILMACSVLIFFLVYKFAVGRSIPLKYFNFIDSYITPPDFLGKSLFAKGLMFFIFHLLFSNIVVAVGCLKPSWRAQIPPWLFWGLASTSILGSIPGVLSSMASASYYFSNVSQMIALPLLVVFIVRLIKEMKNVSFNSFHLCLGASKRSLVAVFILTLFFTLHFLFAFLPCGKNIVNSAKTLVKNMRQDSTVPYNSSTIKNLQKVSSDPLNKDMMVYVSRSEKLFWGLKKLDAMIFMLPAISERCALRSLPSPKIAARYTDFDAYKYYSLEMLTRAQVVESDDVLIEEAHELGFKGVIFLSEKGVRIIK